MRQDFRIRYAGFVAVTTFPSQLENAIAGATAVETFGNGNDNYLLFKFS